MNIIKTVRPLLRNEEAQEVALRSAGLTCLAGVCGYAGTFFFSTINPKSGALYLISAALTTQLVYEVLEKMKESAKLPRVKHVITAIQYLQIPLVLYFIPAFLTAHLTRATKLEIIIVTAHFVAIPVFCHLAIKAWNDPTLANIASAMGVMLSLANGLRNNCHVAP